MKRTYDNYYKAYFEAHPEAHRARQRRYYAAHPEEFKALQRRAKRKAAYGMTEDEYNAMFEAQKGLCAICGLPETKTFKGVVKQLSVDHDHKTGKIRMLLCSDCNIGIGHFKDNPKLLTEAARYLTLFQPRENTGLVISDEALARWYYENKEFVDSERARLFS